MSKKPKGEPKFSMRQVLKDKFGEPEKNKETARSTKRAKRKGKYKVYYDADGTKHMILRD